MLRGLLQIAVFLSAVLAPALPYPARDACTHVSARAAGEAEHARDHGHPLEQESDPDDTCPMSRGLTACSAQASLPSDIIEVQGTPTASAPVPDGIHSLPQDGERSSIFHPPRA